MRSRFLSFLSLNWLFGNLLLGISVIVTVLVALPASAKLINPSTQTIVVFGDSLSAGYGIGQNQGWVSLLQTRLTQQKLPYQVVNASISGETTSGGLARFSEMLSTHKPSIVIRELGANDGLRGLPVSDMRSNLNSMILQAKAAKSRTFHGHATASWVVQPRKQAKQGRFART